MSLTKKRIRAQAIQLNRVFLRPLATSSSSSSATPLPSTSPSPNSYIPHPYPYPHPPYPMSSPLSPSGSSSGPPPIRFLRKRSPLRSALLLLLFAATFGALWLLIQPKEVDLARYAAGREAERQSPFGHTPQRPGPPDRRPSPSAKQEEERPRPAVPDAPTVPSSSPPPEEEEDEDDEDSATSPVHPVWEDPKLYRFPPIEEEKPREIDLRWWVENGATWFLETIPALRDAPPPSSVGCTNSLSHGPLLLIAVFSTAKSWEKRDLIRVLGRQGLGEDMEKEVQFRFVVGRTGDKQWEDRLRLEMDRYGDILQLDFPENMDDGKTYQFFRWVGERPEGERPRFAMKTDDDTFLVLPNLLNAISSLDCSQNIYFGTSWGACIQNCYPFYMRGMAYGLSWPLIRWLTVANLAYDEYRSTEDARTGSWFLSLPEGEQMFVLDLERRLGDHDGISIPINSGTVALHAMKSNWLWAEIGVQVMKAWAQEGKEYLFTRSGAVQTRALPSAEEVETEASAS
ncbi:glycosyltransferase family 31 protein [Calocera viscosa TUFC12733]|uniref:Glycosyltransferase family 31 protein n=1 Tax=Calocera viscosa (strain TUFC12733) TaxID=1330018 RepID=A0A167MJL6_CALVF|nr:glycosyltransferase family 31 protein [Calocera viscosa TUFC12733]